ncbi:MAG: YceD family protein [Hyphomicrobiaceae bacterium]
MAGLDWTINVTDIARDGLKISTSLAPEACQQLAGDLGILAIDGLRVEAAITPRSGGRYHLAGALSADVQQACVVSLDPVASAVRADLDIELRPGSLSEEPDAIEANESFLDEPDIDVIENGVIDLGRIIYEELATNLDPFPRSLDAELEQSEAGRDDGESGPFAALRGLRSAKNDR